VTTYRVGTHHGVTINREGDGHRCDRPGHDCARGHLVAVVTDGDQELAERICAALNDREPEDGPVATGETVHLIFDGSTVTSCCWRTPFELPHGHRLTVDISKATCAGHLPADSCTCPFLSGADPACPVHQGRRARGPKPPPLGPGCICDGSGRTCPRHGAVL
jgi:hypothetical protein